MLGPLLVNRRWGGGRRLGQSHACMRNRCARLATADAPVVPRVRAGDCMNTACRAYHIKDIYAQPSQVWKTAYAPACCRSLNLGGVLGVRDWCPF